MHWAGKSCVIIYAGDSLPSHAFSLFSPPIATAAGTWALQFDFALFFCSFFSRGWQGPQFVSRLCCFMLPTTMSQPYKLRLPHRIFNFRLESKCQQEPGLFRRLDRAKPGEMGESPPFGGFLMLAFYRFIFRVIKAISWEGGLRLFLF